jgi:hypothetical protein
MLPEETKTHYRPSDHLNYQFKWCPTHIYIPQPHISSGRVIQPVVNLRTLYTLHTYYIIYIYILYTWCFGLRRFSPPYIRFRISFSLTHPNHGHLFYLFDPNLFSLFIIFFSCFRIIIRVDIVVVTRHHRPPPYTSPSTITTTATTSMCRLVTIII